MCNQPIGRQGVVQKISCNSAEEERGEAETLILRPRRRRMDSPPYEHLAQLLQTQTQDEGQKVKFLCSFGGSIMPRPQDGKLRYVGGETRIVSLPRDTNYEELMAKMRELFEGAMVLKYQQPDEDLDALVSVVNDDDVTNMMEEYDKLGAGDGFTRLRMFLFPHPDHDFASSSPHFESDERESERRYVDALNSSNDCGGLEFRLQQSPDSPGIEPMNNPTSVEFGRNFEMPMSQFNLRQLRIPHLGGQHQQQQQQPHAQRYSEMEAPWSPAYYSPRHHGHRDGRPVTEYTLSPSSGRYRVGYGEAQSPFTENVVWLPAAPVPNDNSGFPVNLGHPHNVFEGNSICEHCRMGFHRNPSSVDPTRYSDPRWLAGTPAQPHMDGGNEFHQFSGPCSACNSGREAYVFNPDANLEHGVYAKEQSDPRNFYNEAHERGWAMHHPHMNHQVEEPRMSMPMPGTTWINEQHVVDGVGVNGPIAQGNIGVNGSIAQGNIGVNGSIAQGNIGINGIAQGNIGVNGVAQGNIGVNGVAQGNIGVNGSISQGNNGVNGSIAQGNIGMNGIAQGNIGVNGVAQGNISVNGCIPHGNIGVNGPIAQGNIGVNGPIAQGNFINHVDPRCIPVGPELGEHAVVAGLHGPIPPVDECGISYGNFPAAYGTDNAYQLPQGPAPAHALWIKMQNPMQHSPSYEALNMLPQANGNVNSGFPQSFRESSPSFHVGLDNPNAWAGQSHKIYAVNGLSLPEYPHGYVPPMVNSNMPVHENPNLFTPDPSLPPGGMTTFVETAPMVSAIDDKVLTSTTPGYNPGSTDATDAVGEMRLEEKTMLEEGTKVKLVQTVEGSHIPDESTTDKSEVVVEETKESVPEANELKPAEEDGDTTKLIETDGPATLEAHAVLVENLSFLPELIASVKQAALESAEEMKATVQGNIERDVVSTSEKAATQDLDPENADVDVEDESEGDHQKAFGIEQTKAEAEALDKGLQTIKNDDLEEIRELGSGTYGSVYHGKWKGSDVAIKRIKASRFAGRPSERERLIADFWKEALILSSLHHPNVVSFYGIVRDGPDGSLATVTEFMINGSLKQFLQKKDRTIDRRKRLLLAMDTAFGMEYLHGKNIVHFDLKCENLLVNMRDPHRPICKIGDLGLSKVKQHTLVSGGVRGTLPWMAPELLSGKSNMVTEKIDVYSYGIVMWEMLTGEEPYADMHCASIIGGIVNNSLRPQIPPWCDPEWKSLMESCWSGEPGERPSFSEISQKLRKMAAAINLK